MTRLLVIRYHPELSGDDLDQHEGRVRAAVHDAFSAQATFEHIPVERALWERPSIRMRGYWSLSRANVLKVLAECFLDASGAA